MLSKHKRLLFSRQKSKYQSWNITELQNWLISASYILRKYRDQTITLTRTDTSVTTSQLNHNTNQPYQHKVHLPHNNNHYISSTITKFYLKQDTHMIPTSIDLDLQKADNKPTLSITTTPHKPSVRNTSLYLSSNLPIPITTSQTNKHYQYYTLYYRPHRSTKYTLPIQKYNHIHRKINPTTIYRPKNT